MYLWIVLIIELDEFDIWACAMLTFFFMKMTFKKENLYYSFQKCLSFYQVLSAPTR